MPVRRVDDTIFLEGVCAVEDAEVLLQHIQEGAAMIDWGDCTHLHAACLQVMLAARLSLRGMPNNPAIARWLAPILHAIEMPSAQPAGAEPMFELET
jgi:hypothetical protein